MTDYRIDLPDEFVGGTYADGARSSRRGHSVVLDFVVRDDRQAVPDVEVLRVVSRIRLDITSVQRILSNLAGLMNAYDEEQRPLLGPDADGPGEEPPADPQPGPGEAS